MPRVNVYIRNEDYKSWESIKDKPTFLHNAIELKDRYLELSTADKQELKIKLENIPVEMNTPARRLDNGLCKVHGLPLDARGRCLQKGCKYA
jgi:hypothetical protein